MAKFTIVLVLAIVLGSSAWAVSHQPTVLSFWDTRDLFFAYWQGGKNNNSRSEVLRNVGLLLVGVIGLTFGIWRAWTAHRQAKIAEQGQFTERFTNAAEQLGSLELSVRLGGIYSLWRLARDSDDSDLFSVCAHSSVIQRRAGRRSPLPNRAIPTAATMPPDHRHSAIQRPLPNRAKPTAATMTPNRRQY